MRFPLTICSQNRLIIAPHGWFDGIGCLDISNRMLRINVNRLGEAGIKWFLDANGQFCEFTWQGLESATMLQKLGLAKRVEKYSLSSLHEIRAGELAKLIANLGEAFEDVSNSADIRSLLLRMAPDDPINRKFMQEYLGE
jgi:hypothetical protein